MSTPASVSSLVATGRRIEETSHNFLQGLEARVALMKPPVEEEGGSAGHAARFARSNISRDSLPDGLRVRVVDEAVNVKAQRLSR